MCILIHHSATTAFNNEMLADFYSYNPDGFGVMYGDGKKIHVTKSLGSAKEIADLYRDIAEGRECIIHYRMKTHGNVDTANCHPYRITDELWVAHNGILSASNPLRPEMSDTWHLIEYIIKPIAETNPDLIFDPDWQKYLGALIGSSNKLGFAHADGRFAIINRKSGVEFMDAWLSNTYAWSADKYGVRTVYAGYQNRGSLHYGYEDYEGWDYGIKQLPITSKKEKQFDYHQTLRRAYKSYRKDKESMVSWVEKNPEQTEFLLTQWYQLDDDQLDEMIIEHPEQAADWLIDIFESSAETETGDV